MSGLLQGRRIAVTRPRGQAASLAALIAGQGGEAIVCPLLEISPADDPEPLRSAIARLDSYSLAVFISPNAVAFSLPQILARRPWPAALRAVAVGQGSVALLATYGIENALVPKERFDSEGVLALPELQRQQVAGRRAVIFRGNGGRELLADTLRERAVEVDCVSCYQRSAPSDVAALQEDLRRGELDAVTVSSSEALRHLVRLLDDAARARLARTPVFVLHPRIAELAQQLGLRNVVLTAPADAGLVAALCAHRWC